MWPRSVESTVTFSYIVQSYIHATNEPVPSTCTNLAWRTMCSAFFFSVLDPFGSCTKLAVDFFRVVDMINAGNLASNA